jgi:hypothetical protein
MTMTAPEKLKALKSLNENVHAAMRAASKLGLHDLARSLTSACSDTDRAVDQFSFNEEAAQ